MLDHHSNTRIKSVEFQTSGLTIAGLRSNAGSPNKVLAIHGWLDNANSFLPMMPYLDTTDLVAIDLPGHGHSSHIDPGAHYHFIDIMHTVFDVASSLGWDEFHLMGHSLGACITPYAAVANPELLLSIIMLEATGPLTEKPEELPARLRRSVQDRASEQHKTPRMFPTLDLAVETRLRATTMLESSARLIVERQMTESTHGFQWRFDTRHKMASPVYMVEEQVLAVLSEVAVPVLTITAEDGYLIERDQTKPRLEILKTATHHRVPGHHHMHMDDPQNSARLVNQFLDGLGSEPV